MWVREEIEVVSEDKLSKTAYIIAVNDRLEIILDGVYNAQRQTTRHSWKIAVEWERLGRVRGSQKPNIPDEIKEIFVQKVRDRVKFVC